MCCLFGYFNYSGQGIKDINTLTNSLAEQATVRGTDATGIAYNDRGRMIIHKEPKSAYMITLRHPENAVCVTGHTRHATQGNKKHNYNNHPFGGSCGGLRFALCHNGIITNDTEIKNTYRLPRTKIETDSHVAVQLLEKKKQLNIENIKFMAETIRGSFAFSILDNTNTLRLVRGDNPLSLVHLPNFGLYVYASTDEILYKALVDTKLFSEIKSGKFEEIKINTGDILSITPDGEITYDNFEYMDYYSFYGFDYYGTESLYIDDLKAVAAFHGYSEDDIDELLTCGFTPEEIEEYIFVG